MIKQYIIDGNNVIGKIRELKKLQKTNGQGSREKLAYKVDRYFNLKKLKVSLHFDGYLVESIKTRNLKIYYSNNETADDLIKAEISYAKNPKVLCVVSSDLSVYQFAKKNACKVMLAEEFANLINTPKEEDEEEAKLKSISDDEVKKMFGL